MASINIVWITLVISVTLDLADFVGYGSFISYLLMASLHNLCREYCIYGSVSE